MNPLVSIGIRKVDYIIAHVKMQAFGHKKRDSFIEANLLLLAANFVIVSVFNQLFY